MAARQCVGLAITAVAAILCLSISASSSAKGVLRRLTADYVPSAFASKPAKMRLASFRDFFTSSGGFP